jgi:acyl-CoA thioesterase FadM
MYTHIRATYMDNTSVRRLMGMFAEIATMMVVKGHLICVCVDRYIRGPTNLPDNFKHLLRILL